MLLPTAATAINTYTTIDHCMYIFWPAKFLKYDSLENFHLPYSGFYWRTANLAISSFLQIGEDLTWRSLPTSHHTHINIDHTHHEIVIHCIIDNCMHACMQLSSRRSTVLEYTVVFTPLLWLLAFCNLQHCLICLSELQFCQR